MSLTVSQNLFKILMKVLFFSKIASCKCATFSEMNLSLVFFKSLTWILTNSCYCLESPDQLFFEGQLLTAACG